MKRILLGSPAALRRARFTCNRLARIISECVTSAIAFGERIAFRNSVGSPSLRSSTAPCQSARSALPREVRQSRHWASESALTKVAICRRVAGHWTIFRRAVGIGNLYFYPTNNSGELGDYDENIWLLPASAHLAVSPCTSSSARTGSSRPPRNGSSGPGSPARSRCGPESIARRSNQRAEHCPKLANGSVAE